MKVKSESEVAQSCLTLLDHMDCSLQGSSAHGIFQARVLEWVAVVFIDDTNSYSSYVKPLCLFVFVFLVTPQGMWDLSFMTRNQTCISCSGSMEP